MCSLNIKEFLLQKNHFPTVVSFKLNSFKIAFEMLFKKNIKLELLLWRRNVILSSRSLSQIYYVNN